MEEEKIVKQNNKSKIEQKRCPSCNSSDIELNPVTGKLRCNYCKHEFEPEKVEGLEPNMIVEVMQKGYLLKDKVIRHAMVKVSE